MTKSRSVSRPPYGSRAGITGWIAIVSRTFTCAGKRLKRAESPAFAVGRVLLDPAEPVLHHDLHDLGLIGDEEASLQREDGHAFAVCSRSVSARALVAGSRISCGVRGRVGGR